MHLVIAGTGWTSGQADVFDGRKAPGTRAEVIIDFF